MARKNKKVGAYEAWELSVKEMMPIMRVMSEDSEDGQIELMSVAVKQNGQSVGREAIEEMGMSEYMSLISVVTDLNGMDTEGND